MQQVESYVRQVVEDIEVKKFSVDSSDVQVDRNAVKNGSRSQDALEGKTARATFKALQVTCPRTQRSLRWASRLKRATVFLDFRR